MCTWLAIPMPEAKNLTLRYVSLTIKSTVEDLLCIWLAIPMPYQSFLAKFLNSTGIPVWDMSSVCFG